MIPSELCVALGNGLPALFECAPAPIEGVIVHTPFMYPDGGIIDVVVIERNGQYVITDHGEALGWLGMQSARGNLSPKQQSLVSGVCQTLGIELNRGRLVLRCNNLSELGDAIHIIGQAVVRVSDVWFTLRRQSTETIKDEVSEWLDEKNIPFKSDLLKVGRSGREWRMDYQTQTESQQSLVYVLSTGSRGSVHRITEHALSGWFDLNHLKEQQSNCVFISLFDDTLDIWREEDFKILNDLSQIALWSRPDQFERMLKAAR